MKIHLIVLAMLLTFAACGGGGGSSAGGGGSSAPAAAAITTRFNDSARDLVATDLVATGSTTTYSGTFLSYNSATTTATTGSFSFVITNSGGHSYFTTVTVNKTVSTSSYVGAPTPVYAGATSCLMSTVYNAVSNHVDITAASSRKINFAWPTGSCGSAGLATSGNYALFADDFSTVAGGDGSTFFFIAQKGITAPVFSLADLSGIATVCWFTVSGGNINDVSGMSSAVGVTGAGTWSSGGATGSQKLLDTSGGGYIYNYSSTPAVISGGFLLAPDKTFVLGVDWNAAVHAGTCFFAGAH